MDNRYTHVLCTCLVLALVTTSCAFSRHPHPCGDSHRHSWIESELSDALDDAATQAMPSALVAFGWRKHQSGRWSYKGFDAPFPRREHYHRDEPYFDWLFPGPQPEGGRCSDNYGCCSHLCLAHTCVPAGTPVTCPGQPQGGTNPDNTSGWNCTGTTPVPEGTICTAECEGTGTPYSAVCGRTGTWRITGGTCDPDNCVRRALRGDLCLPPCFRSDDCCRGDARVDECVPCPTGECTCPGMRPDPCEREPCRGAMYDLKCRRQ